MEKIKSQGKTNSKQKSFFSTHVSDKRSVWKLKTLKEDKAAIILCGGKGSRLGVLGKRLPKSLVQVQKKEILWYIINILSKNKFSHLILPTGYKGNVIKNFVKKKI